PPQSAVVAQPAAAKVNKRIAPARKREFMTPVCRSGASRVLPSCDVCNAVRAGRHRQATERAQPAIMKANAHRSTEPARQRVDALVKTQVQALFQRLPMLS